ncbi:MAG: helix-turn-helix transcriptional regulator [Bacteroidales bacterium]|nr:helix-turn-helix transcriptional regulator [Bacteroidales bacterium]
MATQTNLHIGQMIKAVFDESGMTVSEFARRIHLERTTVYSIFERSTVDVIQLAKISKVLKHNFLSDVEQRYGLQPESASITFRIESLTPEVANQLASLMDGLLHSVP